MTGTHDQDLGLEVRITRRDFQNATLLGSGASLLEGARAVDQLCPA